MNDPKLVAALNGAEAIDVRCFIVASVCEVRMRIHSSMRANEELVLDPMSRSQFNELVMALNSLAKVKEIPVNVRIGVSRFAPRAQSKSGELGSGLSLTHPMQKLIDATRKGAKP